MANTKENFYIFNRIILFMNTILSLQWISLVSASTEDKLGAQLAYGSFKNPGAVVRLRFRYWLPDAGVNDSIVQENIQSAGAIGAGGVESTILFVWRRDPVCWSWTGLGHVWIWTDAFRKVFIASLQAHKDNELVMDFALGPNQGQGVPARTDDGGLQWDLAPFSVPVSASGSFSGVIPGWGTGELIALSTQNLSLPASSVPLSEPAQTSYLKMVLRSGSLKNHIDAVSVDGVAQLQLPNNATHRLFAFYQYLGNYAWEDSVGATCNMSWTPSLPELFVAKHGYNLTTFLPLVMFGNNNLIQTSPGLIECILDTPDLGQGYVNDYRDTLVLGYRQYFETLTAWTNLEFGVQMSAQVSYNLPMDMEANIPFVNTPECESLGFHNNLDSYRRFVGPAILAEKRVVSNEMGAELLQAYRMPT
ncbi:hypothetical protein ACMFMF_001639 [Clarireedia jacksonii]